MSFHHSIIPVSFPHCVIILMTSHHFQLILTSKHHSNVILLFPAYPYNIPSFPCHSVIPCSFRYSSIIGISFHHLSVIPLIIVHVDNLPSFGCHSMHSMVIRAVEWQGMKLRRNDRDEVGMMILVILNTFPSFLSSQMFGKNVVFLDFIPIIPASFRHSGVIPKFHFNWNDAGMTNDFGLKLTTFPLNLITDKSREYYPTNNKNLYKWFTSMYFNGLILFKIGLHYHEVSSSICKAFEIFLLLKVVLTCNFRQVR